MPALALIMMQVGFLGHDAGHNGILHRSHLNRVAGVVLYPLLLGLSFETWVASHNAHHAHTNEVDADPDINNPLIAFTPEQAAGRRGLLRWIARHQAYLYFLVAQNGTWLIKHRAGDATTHDVVGRTPNAAVKQPGADGSSANALEVRVGADKIDYAVNGTVVHSTPRSGMTAKTDGIYGVRINHALEVHVEKFGVKK